VFEAEAAAAVAGLGMLIGLNDLKFIE